MKLTKKKIKLAWKHRAFLWKHRRLIRRRKEIAGIAAAIGAFGLGMIVWRKAGA